MPTHYSRFQIILHWAVVALMAIQFLLPDGMSSAFRAMARGGEKVLTPFAALHLFTGLLIIALVVWRLVLRKTHGVPPQPEGESPLMQKVAHITHLAIYALMLIVPLSGIAAWGGEVLPAGEVHEVLQNLLLIVIILHVAAALYHQFILKDNLIDRMKRWN